EDGSASYAPGYCVKSRDYRLRFAGSFFHNRAYADLVAASWQPDTEHHRLVRYSSSGWLAVHLGHIRVEQNFHPPDNLQSRHRPTAYVYIAWLLSGCRRNC